MTAVAKTTRLVWLGRTMSGLFILFMLGASIAPKLFFPEASGAYKIMDQIGWPQKYLPLIGIIELVGMLLYAIPKTSLLGAVLMTGLLGGAMASHLRIASPLYSHTLFGLYLGVIMWGGLWLRCAALRALLPVRETSKLQQGNMS